MNEWIWWLNVAVVVVDYHWWSTWIESNARKEKRWRKNAKKKYKILLTISIQMKLSFALSFGNGNVLNITVFVLFALFVENFIWKNGWRQIKINQSINQLDQQQQKKSFQNWMTIIRFKKNFLFHLTFFEMMFNDDIYQSLLPPSPPPPQSLFTNVLTTIIIIWFHCKTDWW